MGTVLSWFPKWLALLSPASLQQNTLLQINSCFGHSCALTSALREMKKETAWGWTLLDDQILDEQLGALCTARMHPCPGSSTFSPLSWVADTIPILQVSKLRHGGSQVCLKSFHCMARLQTAFSHCCLRGDVSTGV